MQGIGSNPGISRFSYTARPVRHWDRSKTYEVDMKAQLLSSSVEERLVAEQQQFNNEVDAWLEAACKTGDVSAFLNTSPKWQW